MLKTNPCPSDEVARVAAMARQKSRSETDAPDSGDGWSGASWMTSSSNGEACDEILHLTGCALQMEAAQQQLNEPLCDLDGLIFATGQGRRLLEQEQVRLTCLRASNHQLPQGAQYVKEEFSEATSRFLNAATRLADRLNVLEIINDSNYLEILRALISGAPLSELAGRKSDKQQGRLAQELELDQEDDELELELELDALPGSSVPQIGRVSAPRDMPKPSPINLWEQTAACELRLVPSGSQVPSEARQLERWCLFWTVALAAERLWVERCPDLPGWDPAEADTLLARVEAAKDLALRVTVLCTGRIAELRLRQLDRTVTQLFDVAEKLVNEQDIASLHHGDPISRILAARKTFAAGARKVTKTDELPAKPHPFAARSRGDLGKLSRKTQESRRPDSGRRPLRRGGALVAVVMLVAGALSWEPLFEPMLNVSTLNPARLSASSGVVSSGYLVGGDHGETLVGQVSNRWSTIKPADRERVVQSLLQDYRQRGVNEVLLTDSNGQIVARWIPGRLALAQVGPRR